MKKLVVIFVLLLAYPAIAFEANSIWLKGDVDLAVYKKLDPTMNIDGFEIGNDEPVTLYVTYRDPARDDQNWSKVTFNFDMVNPNGQLEFAEEPKKEIVAGEGIVSDEHLKDWGASRGRVTLAFSKEDDRGIYIARVTIRDHVSGEVIRHITRIFLKGLEQISSEKEFGFFMNMYYMNPQPELIPQAIRFLSSSKSLKNNKNAGPPMLGFFAKVFGDNPELVDAWKKVIKKQDRQTRKLLNRAIKTELEILFLETGTGAALNDMYWGAFFSSGDIQYVDRIIEHLNYLDERVDINQYIAAATAKWSLSTNAKKHPAVWRAIAAMKTSSIPNQGAIAEEILSTEPSKILDEMIAVLKEQREKGLWVSRP